MRAFMKKFVCINKAHFMKINFVLPWWLKILVKIVLASLPAKYKLWASLGIFRHGKMDTLDYPINVFEFHFQRIGQLENLNGKTILELGPGDSIATAIIAKAVGANCILVDVDDYATYEIDFYRKFAHHLHLKGYPKLDLSGVNNIYELLVYCDAKYYTNGLDGLREVLDQSVDYIFSHTVLQHVRKHEFFDCMVQLNRLLKFNGICSHRVDLSDCIDDGLNNLRFSNATWESYIFVNSGFYTNRIRYCEYIIDMERIGLIIKNIETREWSKLPISNYFMSEDFKNHSKDELIIKGFDVVCFKPIR